MFGDRRGMTLVEALVASTLLLLLFYMIFMLVRPSLRYSRTGLEKIDRLQTASHIIRNLRRDLIRTVPSGASFAQSEDRVRLGIHPLGGVLATGHQVWLDQIILYRWTEESRRLSSSTLSSSGGTLAIGELTVRARTLDEGTLDSLVPRTHEERAIGSDVEKIRLEWNGKSRTMPLTVDFTLTAEVKPIDFSFKVYFPQSL